MRGMISRSASPARAARPAVSADEQCRRIVERIAAVTGEAWTFGYIGNVSHHGDDRSWAAFRPHPGRVGTSADQIGEHATEDLDVLAQMLRGALRMAIMLKGA